MGLKLYTPNELFDQLLTPATLLVLAVLQLRQFQERFLSITAIPKAEQSSDTRAPPGARSPLGAGARQPVGARPSVGARPASAAHSSPYKSLPNPRDSKTSYSDLDQTDFTQDRIAKFFGLQPNQLSESGFILFHHCVF